MAGFYFYLVYTAQLSESFFNFFVIIKTEPVGSGINYLTKDGVT